MERLIWIVVGIIIYFGGGWIAKDIVFSMIDITEETTLGDLTLYEYMTYSVIAGVVCLVPTFYKDNSAGFLSLFAIGIMFAVVKEMPLSMGLIILYNIINIGGIIWAVCTNEDIN